MATHYTITPGPNNQPIQSPLKQWVRQNVNQLPNGFITERTSHELRRSLRQLGWHLDINDNEVFVIKPDNQGSFDYASDLIGELEADQDRDENEEQQILEITFGLEKDMQSALRKNISSLESGLTIIDNGSERNTIAGRIDITARDTQNRTVVIELKAVDAKPDVLAQTLAYMEAVKGEDKCEVRGIIVASSFPDKVKLAAKQISNLKLYEYKFQFNFLAIE
jgi:hypothetical protein